MKPQGLEALRGARSAQRAYFRQAARTIAASNFTVLHRLCCGGFLLTPVLCLCAWLLVPGWLPAWRHAIIWVLFGAFWLGASLLRRRGQPAAVSVMLLCSVCCVALPGSYLAFASLSAPPLAAGFFALALALCPAIFDFPFAVCAAALTEDEAICAVLMLLFWPEAVRGACFFFSLCGYGTGMVLGWCLCCRRAKQHLTTLRYQRRSRVDGLTGILNKGACERACRQYLSGARSCLCALFMLDLDNFKQINDTRGHPAGDRVLEAVGETLMHLFRETDIVGRFGGDEFCVLMKDIASTSLLRERAVSMRAAVEQTGREVLGDSLGCSIGIAVAQPEVPVSYEALLHLADDALYTAKARGKHCSVTRLADARSLETLHI